MLREFGTADIVTEETIRVALGNAVLRTYDEDRVLFGDRTNERSVLFHVGRRLARELARWDRRWSVDLEYNRWHEADLDVAQIKELELGSGSARKRVYPDLIVHDRSGSTPDCNLLVLEAKYHPSHAERLDDYRKLAAFQASFGYEFAVFLEFPRRAKKPRWYWLTPGMNYSEEGLPQPIM